MSRYKRHYTHGWVSVIFLNLGLSVWLSEELLLMMMMFFITCLHLLMQPVPGLLKRIVVLWDTCKFLAFLLFRRWGYCRLLLLLMMEESEWSPTQQSHVVWAVLVIPFGWAIRMSIIIGFSNWVRPVSKELMHLLSLCAVLPALLNKSVDFVR